MTLTVHSDEKRKPRYWVTEDERVVFESDYAHIAVQWAIAHDNYIELDRTIVLTSGALIKGKEVKEK
jgi:hypothetical protein